MRPDLDLRLGQIALAAQLADEFFQFRVPGLAKAADKRFAQETVERQMQFAALAHGVGTDGPAVVGQAGQSAAQLPFADGVEAARYGFAPRGAALAVGALRRAEAAARRVVAGEGAVAPANDAGDKVAVRINLGNDAEESGDGESDGEDQDQEQAQDSEGQASSVEGILESYDTNEQAYVVSLLDDQAVEEGMQVVTSGKGGIYPSGLFVGTVKKVETLDNQLGQVIYVEPVSNFQYFDYVTVIEVN